MAKTDHYICPCCGYTELEQPPYREMPVPPFEGALPPPPYAPHFGDPSYEVCDCCGFEFGYDDEPGTAAPVSFAEYLGEWIADGAEWFVPEKRPPHWDLHTQLASAGIAWPAGAALR